MLTLMQVHTQVPHLYILLLKMDT